ncbi:MAG TPA: hypothetical protein VNU71_06680 [Burkholderiaceae bacterium]|nr:hypothetical protein [Burkholderiaceae bacterium]
MRVIFGVLSLLVVLAIMGTVAKKQLQAISSSGVSTRINQMSGTAPANAGSTGGDRDGAMLAIPGGMPGGVAADTSGLTVPQQAQNIQQQFKQSTERALQQGADRNARNAP